MSFSDPMVTRGVVDRLPALHGDTCTCIFSHRDKAKQVSYRIFGWEGGN